MVRADSAARLRKDEFGRSAISEWAGLSPQGRVVVARLENTRLLPGRVAEAIAAWEEFLRDPAYRLYDPRYEGCGIWACCPPMREVGEVLHIVVHALPRADARRLIKRLDDHDQLWRWG